MKLGIGIDTGGTCTDAVLYDYENRKVLASAKALTTRRDLSIGIRNALNRLPSDLVSQAQTLALSTTLATNACVEEKGGRAKLILYGTDLSYAMRIIGKNGNITDGDLICYDSQTTCDGVIQNMPDWDILLDELKTALKDCQAAAVVEIYSRQTGAFLEQSTQQILLEHMDLPVVCGYEMFHELDFIKRGASCLLNARLIPVIDTFLKAVSRSAAQAGITCDPVIVRSDGTLMSREFARIRPVETLLCGPVASVMGARELTQTDHAVIVDMGGTTTDVAILQHGEPLRVNGGIHVGNWNTFVKGLFVDTFALGGDSGVRILPEKGIYLDNRRVIPLCILAEEYPFVEQELRKMADMGITSTRSIHEYYILQQDIDTLPGFSQEERLICSVLKERPLNMKELCEKIHIPVYNLDTSHLESENIIMRAGLTPTDIMHIRGDYTAYNSRASFSAAAILSNCADTDVENLCTLVYDLVKEKLFSNLARILLEQQFSWIRRDGLDSQLKQLIHESWKQYTKKRTGKLHKDESSSKAACISSNTENCMSPLFHTDFILIGIGGPIHIFLEDVAEAFGTRAIIPKHAAVANAIGAAVCQVSFTITIRVTPAYNEYGGVVHYTVFSPGDAREFSPDNLEAAREYARERAQNCAKEEAVKRGLSSSPDIHTNETIQYFSGLNVIRDILMEASV
ncbi:MAG: hydantoinase/oxoprolinase family protein [Lachnospiraceae bacterium]|nr:hydantoinase/oxoprolinase family protein [Lachnospiraceae bacterium]